MGPRGARRRGRFGHEGGGQSGGGVVGHERAQVRRDADGARGLARVGRSEHAPNALGVACLVDGQQRGEVVAGARIDQVDAGEVPSRDAQAQLQQRAVRGGDLEAHALDSDGAVAAPLFARDLGAERAPQGVGAGALASDGWARAGTDRAASRESPECTLRWYSSSTQAWVAVLSRSSESSGSPSSMGSSRPSICPQKDSCFPFCSGEYGSVVWWTMPSRSRPSTVSAASIAAPLSVRSARGSARFWKACDRACTSASAVSSRYHCRWQQRRERSSRMPRSWGFCHCPVGQ